MKKLADQPAFPSSVDPNARVRGDGLTKREYFAGLALQGMLANPYISEQNVAASEAGVKVLHLHEIAVRSADSLLAELESGENEKI